nr:MAG TPA: hypothetical protein [Caudoviricetes sp.]
MGWKSDTDGCHLRRRNCIRCATRCDWTSGLGA